MEQEIGGHKILIIQCDCGHLYSNLIACARHKVIDEIVVPQTSTKEEKTENINDKESASKETEHSIVHVVFIVQLPRKAGGTNFVGFQGGDWLSVHLDDLRPLKENELSFQNAVQCSISEIFYSMYQSVTSAASENKLEPVSSERKIEPISSEHKVEPLTPEQKLEPSTSEQKVESSTPEQDIEPSACEQNVESSTSEQKIEPSTSEEKVKSSTSEQDIEPSTSEQKTEPSTSEQEAKKSICSLDHSMPLDVSQTLDVARNKLQSVPFNANRRLRDLIQMACSWLYDTEQNRERTTKRIIILTDLIPTESTKG